MDKDLFGHDIPEEQKQKENSRADQSHKKLIAIYGAVENKCKNCKHFLVKEYAGRYFKCLIANPHPTGNPKTDWRANWQACGKFELNTEKDG